MSNEQQPQVPPPDQLLVKLKETLPSAEQLARFASMLGRMKTERQVWRSKRSTMTYANASKFIPYITALMENPAQGIDIPQADFPECKLSTLYLKWMGALQFLVESKQRSLVEQQTAALVKATFIAKVNKEYNCLMIRPRDGSEHVTKKSLKRAHEILDKMNPPQEEEWKQVFIEWVSSGEVGVPFIMKNLHINAEGVEFVRNICEQQGWEHSVGMHEIRVMKV